LGADRGTPGSWLAPPPSPQCRADNAHTVHTNVLVLMNVHHVQFTTASNDNVSFITLSSMHAATALISLLFLYILVGKSCINESIQPSMPLLNVNAPKILQKLTHSRIQNTTQTQIFNRLTHSSYSESIPIILVDITDAFLDTNTIPVTVFVIFTT